MSRPEDQQTLVDALLSPEGWAHASLPPTDADDPGRFHALFGRDSLIFALQMLPFVPGIAAATLRALAARQATTTDAETDAEPGKIIHEFRLVAPQWLIDAQWPIRDGQLRYYGTSDATSWFLVVLAATGDAALQDELAPHRRAAAGWLENALERGGGLIRCGPRTLPGGLSQQGWRDALDPQNHPGAGGIVRIDGTEPAAPLADTDSQAVAVAALRALAVLDAERAVHWRARAVDLRARLSSDFTPDVMAREGDDTPVLGAGSQSGWLLWADALLPDAADAAAERLVRPDILTPFGLRTLSAEHPQFRVDGYHRGAVWPFDSWLGWAGLRAHGRHDAAERVRTGVLAAVDHFGLAPELYAVTADGDLATIAASNKAQAWTVGATAALRAGWDGLTAYP